MLRGASSAVPSQGSYRAWHVALDLRRKSCSGIVCNGIDSMLKVDGLRVRVNLRVKSSPANDGLNPSTTILSLGGRRHNRRRDLSGSSEYAKKRRGDDTVEITLDFDELKQRAGEAVVTTKKAVVSSVGNVRQAGANFVNDGKQAWNELRSSVAVQNDKRVVIAVRRSTIEFAGRTLMWTILSIVFARVLLTWARRFRWGWEEGFSWPRTVRDRGLGGKEVVVRNGVKLWEGGPMKKAYRKAAQGLSPLDSVKVDTRSEKELHRLKAGSDPSTFKKVQRESRLPPWWSSPQQAPKLLPEISANAQKEANTLLGEMLEMRMNGVDFERSKIIKLRQLCRDFGARVSFETSSTRDAFYRTAVQLVQDVCLRGGEFPSEGVGNFISGLAANIGLDAERAATIVVAFVAARTRATFLQTWALHERGEIGAANKELEGLVRIHEKLGPVRNSPEMEMSGRAMTYLAVEDRRVLLELYIFAGGRNTEWLAKEALCLVEQ